MSESFKDKNVLIVDDNQDIRELVSRYVKKFAGCNTFVAENGEAALKIINRKRIDLVFLDMMMPHLDGGKL